MILVEWQDANQKEYRASTESFTSSPSCSIAPNVHYPARITNPGGVARYIWKSGQAQGLTTEISYGNVVLANADGGLDALLNLDFDGRPLRILEGPATNTRRDQFTTLFAGTLQGVVVSENQVIIRVRDKAAQVAEQIAYPIRYLGDNVLPAGAQGTPNDYKGKPMPWLLGDCENISPPQVNTSRFIYQISARAIAELVNVWINGSPLTAGTLRANLAALQASAPAGGTYDWCLGNDATGEGAYFRLGSSAANGVVTCHAREGANAPARTAGQIARRLLLSAPGVVSSDISDAAISTIDAAQADSVGWWFAPEDGQQLGTALDAVLLSAGASWTPRRDGVFAPYRMDDPSGYEPVAKFTDADILNSLRVYAAGQGANGLPSYEVALQWGRNWRVQSPTETAGLLNDARRTFLSQEYRTATTSNPTVWSPTTQSGRNPLSQPLRATTQLRTETAAQAESARLLRLFGVKRLMIDMTVSRSILSTSVDLGAVILVTYPRFGLSSGKKFIVTGMDEDWSAGTVRIEGWG